jgi:hypothetical protein
MSENQNEFDKIAANPSGFTRAYPDRFQPLDNYEVSLVKKMLERDRLHDTLRSGALLTAASVYQEDGLFTDCAILIPVDGGSTVIHLGSSKRLSYAPMEDADDPVVGRTIAFCRALSAAPIVLPF